MFGEDEKRCKGVKKCVVKKTLTADDYIKCLNGGQNIYREQMLFQNKKHEIFTSKLNKIALNRIDDKRLIQKDNVTTLARGYTAAWNDM